MAVNAKFIRSQLNILKPVILSCSLSTARIGQDKLGELMLLGNRRSVTVEDRRFDNFEGAWVHPYGDCRDGVILYLHGGGYVCGSLEYAVGFGSKLASELSIPVFCAAYRLAPEHKFPAALDDAFEAYQYLLDAGYRAENIVLCGESAGGGMIYSLCMRLRDHNMPMPCGIIAISPWTDLTSSGKSYEMNKQKDPSMTSERLRFFADHYTDDKKDPYVSPLFGDLSCMPPSLIFVGGDEIMLDDSRMLHSKLVNNGCTASLTVKDGMWHAYLLYDLKEAKQDFTEINEFLKTVLPFERKLRWMRLDNAAKIYPAARKRTWSNLFRLSASFAEDIDRSVMQSSLDVTARRFPSISVRLRRGMFWYYLEEVPTAPQIDDEAVFPLVSMPDRELRSCAFRVIVYKNRVAVEFFHALTDANGGMVFLKSLCAEYIKQKYGVSIPCECGVLDRLEEPKPEELEDSFLKPQGIVSKSRADTDAYRLTGTPEPDGYLNVTTLIADSDDVLRVAHEKKITLTTLLASSMIMAILNIQKRKVPRLKVRLPVKILVPVNLRRMFGSETLRNFVLYITPGVDPRMGEWEFDEICATIHHLMCLQTTKKEMLSRIMTNVNTERLMILKVMPLFIKNIAMKAVYNAVGETKACITLSNIGRTSVPEGFEKYVKRMDFIIGKQSNLPYTCGVLSYGDKLYINFLRTVKESELELEFFKVLRDFGIRVTVESNRRDIPEKKNKR